MKLSIVSYLDIDSTKVVRELQSELSKISGSVASLTSWEPHLTIGDGIEVDSNILESIKIKLESLAHKQSPFAIDLHDIGSRDNRVGGKNEKTTPYVIHLRATANAGLKSLVHEVGQCTLLLPRWYIMPKPYVPHVTLAFKDLDRSGFDKGLKYFSDKTISVSSVVDHFSLVENLPTVDRELVRFNFN